MKTKLCLAFASTLTVAGFFLPLGVAESHAVLEVNEAKANSTYKGILVINHGCGRQPTISVKIDIPDGLIGVKPKPKPGWTLAIEKGAYATSYPTRHGELKEGVKQITWSGGSLPDDFYDTFEFAGAVADLSAGTRLYFPVVQQCATGAQHAWTQIPAEGKPQDQPDEPAPVLTIHAATEVAQTGAENEIRLGSLELKTYWLRATPGGAKVGAGYLSLVNHGNELDRLIGASSAIAGGIEIHSMTMEEGVMRMRQLVEGLEIPPHGKVDLRPGGVHLMLIDLKNPLKLGEVFKIQLQFENAGAVELDFPVASQAPASGESMPEAEHTHMH